MGTVAWGSSWGVSWGDSWGVRATADAGRSKRRRTVYFIEIDGQRIECRSVEEALRLLRAAQERAKEAVEQAVIEEIEPPPPPKITTRTPELKAYVVQAKQVMDTQYRQAMIDTEFRMLMALDEKAEEETLLLFM